MGSGKPRGVNAARKLRTVRRVNRWANKRYKKAHLGTQFKCNPFGGSSHCKGIVLEKMYALAPRAAAPVPVASDDAHAPLWRVASDGQKALPLRHICTLPHAEGAPPPPPPPCPRTLPMPSPPAR